MKVTRKQTFETDELQVGDILTFGGIGFVVIKVEGENRAIIQQYDHIDFHEFNKNGSNVYEGSDLQKYVEEDYEIESLKPFMEGSFFILPEEAYDPEKTDYPFYEDVKNRTKYDSEGCSTWYWTASPYVGDAYSVRSIGPTGGVISHYAGSSIGVAPACRIHLKSTESAPTGAQEEDLLQCPFCSADAEYTRDTAINLKGEMSDKEMHFVGCTECSAVLYGDSKEAACKAWNRRA